MSQPDVSVIIPAYNEAETLAEIVSRVRAVPLSKEIIVVDDGSHDATPTILDEIAGEDLVSLRHPTNRGKGTAIRTAISRARGRAIIIQDADLEYNPQDYHVVLGPILAGQARVIYGSRILNQANYQRSSWAFYLGGRLVSLVTNIIYGSHLTDEPTCYKAFEAQLLKSLPLNCQGFEFCPEVTALVLRRGVPILEVPISYNPRSRAQGKKIKARDGLHAIWVLLKMRFSEPDIKA